MKNTLHLGDNLDVLRDSIPDEWVDLVYLDPPFNSDKNYNAFFEEKDGSRSPAQVRAFKDTWQWDQEAVAAYRAVVEAGGKVSERCRGFTRFWAVATCSPTFP